MKYVEICNDYHGSVNLVVNCSSVKDGDTGREKKSVLVNFLKEDGSFKQSINLSHNEWKDLYKAVLEEFK